MWCKLRACVALVRPPADLRPGMPAKTANPEMTMRHANTAVIGACLVASACTSGSADDRGLNADDVPLREAVEDLRIGDRDDPVTGFSAIHGAAADAQGRIYVFDGQDLQFRVYSPTGEPIRRFAREGEGPGEFRMSPQFGIVGDTLWTIEPFTRRISLFDLDGNVLNVGRIEGVRILLSSGQFGVIMPQSMQPDGRFTGDLTMFTSARDADTSNKPGENDTIQVPRVVFGADGQVADTLGWEPRPPERTGGWEYFQFKDRRVLRPMPPDDRPIRIAVPDGRIVIDRTPAQSGDDAAFTVTRTTLAGDTAWHRVYAYEPVRYSDAYLDSIAWERTRAPSGGVAMISGQLRYQPMPPDSLELFRAIRDGMDFPPFQPPIVRHHVGDDGSLWLRREDTAAPTYRWLVLDAEGRPHAQLDLPRRARPLWATLDQVLVVEPDEFDVPFLVRYRPR